MIDENNPLELKAVVLAEVWKGQGFPGRGTSECFFWVLSLPRTSSSRTSQHMQKSKSHWACLYQLCHLMFNIWEGKCPEAFRSKWRHAFQGCGRNWDGPGTLHMMQAVPAKVPPATHRSPQQRALGASWLLSPWFLGFKGCWQDGGSFRHVPDSLLGFVSLDLHHYACQARLRLLDIKLLLRDLGNWMF